MKPSSRRAIVVLPLPDSPAIAVDVANSLGHDERRVAQRDGGVGGGPPDAALEDLGDVAQLEQRACVTSAPLALQLVEV